MPMIQIGTACHAGQERPVYLVQGNAVRDAERADSPDRAHAKVNLAAARGEQGETLFVTLNGWRAKAVAVAAIRKMDSVLAIGTLKTRSCNGRRYYDLDADFICLSGAGAERGSLAAFADGALPF